MKSDKDNRILCPMNVDGKGKCNADNDNPCDYYDPKTGRCFFKLHNRITNKKIFSRNKSILSKFSRPRSGTGGRSRKVTFQDLQPKSYQSVHIPAYPEPDNKFNETPMTWPRENLQRDSVKSISDKNDNTVEESTPAEVVNIHHSPDYDSIDVEFKVNDSGSEVDIPRDFEQVMNSTNTQAVFEHKTSIDSEPLAEHGGVAGKGNFVFDNLILNDVPYVPYDTNIDIKNDLLAPDPVTGSLLSTSIPDPSIWELDPLHNPQDFTYNINHGF